ncbi:MAG: BrnT family toxin [Alphaproteobacteria bacterium]|nr:BrnT family toxin [Alphaproteobacteria bacterium]
MGIEFDPAKNAANISKHGLALAEFAGFDAPPLVIDDQRQDYGEPRWLAYGQIGGVAHCLVFTLRGETMRLISLRRANDRERTRHGL